MLRVEREQIGRWDLCRHASLCSSKQSCYSHPVSAAKTEENVRLTAQIVTIKEGMEITNNQMD
ncbi:hypothetical protein FE241_19905 [Raoultella terrigena]|nr:hypothetical protein [Raoultella terrigena]